VQRCRLELEAAALGKERAMTRGRVLINRDCSAIAGRRKLPLRCAGCSGDFLPPSPPAEKATARQDQAGQASAGDGSRDSVELQIEYRASTHSPSFTLEVEENAIGRKRGVSAAHTRRGRS
jgi:hypothetical protein